MVQQPFDIVEHTADVGLIARGESLSEVFRNGARGMFTIICDPSAVRQEIVVPVDLEDPDPAYLYFLWLDELIYHFSADRMAFADFEIEVADGRAVGRAKGERIDPVRHDVRLEIKAVTYHGLEVKRTGALWIAQVLFDV
jgi:SHS2 domain-containing protein